MTIQWLTSWWNLIFLMPFALALFYLGLYTASGVTFGEADASGGVDHDMGIDHDLGADHDLSADHDFDHPDADADSDTSADSHDAPSGGSQTPAYASVLSWLGVGRVPLSMLLMVLMISWGVIGFLSNYILWPRLAGNVVLASAPIAATGGLLMARILVTFMARWLPMNETYAQRKHDLLGGVGEAIYSIDKTFGMVSVRDEQGDLFQVPCRTPADQPVIEKGTKVRLIAYNRQGWFSVVPDQVQQKTV